MTKTSVSHDDEEDGAEEGDDAVPLQENLDSIEEGITELRKEECLRDKDSIMMCVVFFQSAVTAVERGLKEGNDDQKEQAKGIAKKTVRLQREMFPKLRDAYGPAAREVLWESDMGARTIGKGYRIIEIWGGMLAANRNKKKLHQEIRGTLKKLRFNQARYKWMKAADEYDYWKLETPSDGDLGIWSGEKWRRVEY